MVLMIRSLLCVALLALGAGMAAANEANAYSTDLKPENVRPEPVEIGYAWGQATLIVEDEADTFFLTLNFFGLESPQTEAWLLRAAADEAGVPLLQLPNGGFFAESYALNQDIADALAAGELVIQIHDQNYPDGAIRGTFEFVTVAIDETSWTAVKDLFSD